MAKETKVGLLAGLAFIVCFAVILANRGTGNRPPVGASYRMYEDVDRGGVDSFSRAAYPQDRGHGAEEVHARGTGRNDVAYHRQVPVRADRVVMDARPERWPEPQRVGVDVSIQGGTSVPYAARQDSVGGEGEAYPAESEFRERTVEDTALTSCWGQEEDAGQPEQRDRWDRSPHDEREVDDGDDYWWESRRDEGVPSALYDAGVRRIDRQPVVEPERSPHQSVRYVVVAGDSLSKIARTHYGTSSGRVVDAIYDANRRILSSPDAIGVGMELLLPVVRGEGGELVPTGGKALAQPTVPSSGPVTTEQRRKGWRTYQIQKGDRYMTIARKELNDASRWREVYELNKDKFGDPQLIREGVWIRIPVP